MSFRLAEEEGADPIVAEINVTPLTDIFLVLLIIFMVTSTALVQQGQPVNLPEGRGDAPASSGVTVTVTSDRQIAVDGSPVAPGELEERLTRALAASPVKSVVLEGDRRVVLEDAVHVLGTAKRAGAEKVAIATQPETGGGGR